MIFQNQNLTAAAYLIFLCAFFDLMDGMTARMLKEYSWFGKELDSMADTVSFGVVPGAIIYTLMMQSNLAAISENESVITALQYFPFVITIFSAIRLAKFIKDLRQSTSFIGLPTPANTLLIVSLPLILMHDEFNLRGIILNPWFLLALSVLQSYLLVAEIPLFALKFTSLSWANNKYQYILILSAIVLLITIQWTAVPLIILLYVLLSLLKSKIFKTAE